MENRSCIWFPTSLLFFTFQIASIFTVVKMVKFGKQIMHLVSHLPILYRFLPFENRFHIFLVFEIMIRVISTWHMHLFSYTLPLPTPTLHYLSTPFGLLFTRMGGKDKKCNLACFFPQSHLILKNNMFKLVNL